MLSLLSLWDPKGGKKRRKRKRRNNLKLLLLLGLISSLFLCVRFCLALLRSESSFLFSYFTLSNVGTVQKSKNNNVSEVIHNDSQPNVTIKTDKHTTNFVATQKAQEEEEEEVQTFPLHLIHVINPYVVDDKASIVPNPRNLSLDLGQLVALDSIRKNLQQLKREQQQEAQLIFHKNNSNNNNNNTQSINIVVDFVCAIFESDLLALSSLPCRKVLLKRSTREEYPTLTPSKQLPFLQDILTASTNSKTTSSSSSITSSFSDLNAAQEATTTGIPANFQKGDYYLMFTNADIGLTNGFYKHLYEYLKENKSLSSSPPLREALSINRVTVPLDGVMTSVTNFWDYVDDQIVRYNNGTVHPGYDCFVIHSSVLKRVHFGNLFLGYPPWGNKVHVILSIMANGYTNIESNIHGTFHLGNDKTWEQESESKTKSKYKFKLRNKMKNKNKKDDNIVFSPEDLSMQKEYCAYGVVTKNNYNIQNTINCGYLFRPVPFRKTIATMDIVTNSTATTRNTTIATNTTTTTTTKERHDVVEVVVPAFVQPGFEEIFLQNYHNTILYNESTGHWKRSMVGLKHKDTKVTRTTWKSVVATKVKSSQNKHY